MLVKLLVGRSGSDGSYSRGDEIEVETAEAVRMFEAGHALPVRGEGESVERAMEIRAAVEAAVSSGLLHAPVDQPNEPVLDQAANEVVAESATPAVATAKSKVAK